MKTLGVVLSFVVAASGAHAALTFEKGEGCYEVKGDHFSIRIDESHGVITVLRLFDGANWNAMLEGSDVTLPMLTFKDKEREYALGGKSKAEFVGAESSPDMVNIVFRTRPTAADGTDSPYDVVVSYEVYPEGTVFVDMDFQLTAKAATLTYAALDFAAPDALRKSAKYRDQNVSKEVGAFPSARVAFGTNPARTYTNEFEMFVEYKDAMGGAVDFKQKNGRWTWVLGQDPNGFDAPLRYHNRVSIGLGAAVTGRPKSVMVGQRVYHWVNWIEPEHWYPTNEQIDAMVANKATTLILHTDWMLQRGKNGYPHADYTVVRNHDEMVRMIDYAHQKGLRVGVYMRGIEMYGLAAEFFPKYLKRDWDGIYVDWHGPVGISWHEMKYQPEDALGDFHFTKDGTQAPARAYFLFTQNLREIVGANGFLIGHEGSFNSGVLANLCFDAYLPGETGSDRRMFADLDEAAYKGMLGGCVCMPWTLDLPTYRNAEGAAKMAAWGFYPHIVMGMKARQKENVTFSLDPNDPLYAFVLPYWRVLAAIDVEKATVFNLPSQNVEAMTSSNPQIQGLVYKAGDDYLVVVANLGTEAADAKLRLNAEVLGLSGTYHVRHVDAATGKSADAGQSDGVVRTSTLAQWGIEGIKLVK